MKILNLTIRQVPKSILRNTFEAAVNNAKDVEHIEVFPNDLPKAPHSQLSHKLNGTWTMHEFWRKQLNKVQIELEARE